MGDRLAIHGSVHSNKAYEEDDKGTTEVIVVKATLDAREDKKSAHQGSNWTYKFAAEEAIILDGAEGKKYLEELNARAKARVDAASGQLSTDDTGQDGDPEKGEDRGGDSRDQ